MAEVGLHIFHAGDLGRLRRARAPEHLMSDALDAGIAAGLFEDTEKEIVRVDCSAARWRAPMDFSASDATDV